jgi:DNA invertase Pin-like site-specific DNA recombinase
MKAALYTRVSTNDGRQYNENQTDELRGFCERMGWEITGEYDDRTGGAKAKRPQLERLMSDASQRRFDVVLVFDLSRFTRGGPAHAFELIYRLKSTGIEFWSLREEQFRTSGPAGEFMLAAAAYFAQAEREQIRARIAAGLERAKKKGTPFGRPRKIAPIARIMHLRGLGWTLRQIAKELRVSKSVVEREIAKNRNRPAEKEQPQ